MPTVKSVIAITILFSFGLSLTAQVKSSAKSDDLFAYDGVKGKLSKCGPDQFQLINGTCMDISEYKKLDATLPEPPSWVELVPKESQKHWYDNKDLVDDLGVTIVLLMAGLVIMVIVRSILAYNLREAAQLHEQVMKYGRPEDQRCEECGRPWELTKQDVMGSTNAC